MQEREEAFNIYPNKGIIYIYGFLAIVAISFFAYIAYGAITQNLLGLLYGIIPALAGYYYIRKVQLLRPTDDPFFTLNEKGIYIRDKGLMPWNTIKSVELILKHRKHRYLTIQFNTQEKELSYYLERRYYDENYNLLEEQLEAFSSRYINQ